MHVFWCIYYRIMAMHNISAKLQYYIVKDDLFSQI